MDSKPRVVLIGDSIRMGYQAAVAAGLPGQAEVWGPEQNGGNSANVLQHLEEWALSRDAAVIHVNCGLHDLRYRADGTYQVPLEEYGRNVGAILDCIRDRAPGTLIWATSTPVIDERQNVGGKFRRYLKDVVRYNQAALAVVSERDVPVDDLFRVVSEARPGEQMTADGVHFNERGNELLAAAVVGAILGATT